MPNNRTVGASASNDEVPATIARHFLDVVGRGTALPLSVLATDPARTRRPATVSEDPADWIADSPSFEISSGSVATVGAYGQARGATVVCLVSEGARWDVGLTILLNDFNTLFHPRGQFVAFAENATFSIAYARYVRELWNRAESIGSTDSVRNWLGSFHCRRSPIFRNTTVAKFSRLVDEWKSSRNLLDSGTSMFTNPAYQQIIGMGHEVVPLILRELERNPDYWFWALKAITGLQADPVKKEHRGVLERMAQDWIAWGRKHGYEW